MFAVVFSSQHIADEEELRSYPEMARAMAELAAKQPGFISMESARNPDGFGITVSYWESREAIDAWRKHEKHRAAQDLGKSKFYERYSVRICSVERAYEKR